MRLAGELKLVGSEETHRQKRRGGKNHQADNI